MKLSLGSWAFSFGPFAENPVPFDRTVARLSEAGYDGIEICGFPPHITLDGYPTPESRKQVTGMLKDYGLGVSGYSADFTSVNPVSEGNQARYLELFRRNVQMSADLGSPTIRVDTVGAPGSLEEKEYRPAFERLAATWREAAEIALRAGVMVVWEFEPGFVFNKPSEVLEMHQQVGHPNFKILFDTSHAFMCGVVGARQYGPRELLAGGVAEFLARLKGRIGHIHLIDSDGTLYGDETSTHRPFGQGRIDFKALAPQLLELPNIQWWCIDMCFCAGSWDLVETSRRFVADLLVTNSVIR
jgi:sugar phosphate isomerase/epimerase